MMNFRKYLALFVCLLLTVCCFCGCYNEDKYKEEEAKLLAQYRAAKVAEYQAENELYADYEVDVAFLGDSLTHLYDVQAYYPQYLVCNRGIGGDTTFDLENRLQVSVYDLKPKVAVMLIGANNFDTMFDNYERILMGLDQHLPNTKIILLSLTSMGGEWWGKKNHIAAYNNVKIKELAEKYEYAFVDLYSPLMNLETGEIYPEYTVDGGHLTAQGYEVLTAKITPEIERQLSAWRAQP
jgi:lysophospholipase L1-like esterase